MSRTASLSEERFLGGAAALLEFGQPPANILDRESISALHDSILGLADDCSLRAIVLRGAGEHFSFGASVQEHLPGEVQHLLPEFHALLRAMSELPLPPLIAAVRGRCLGGGFEVALACDAIMVEHDAQLGCPEVRLGVFPPAAAALLPLRVSAARASAYLTTGRLLTGSEAFAAGVAEIECASGALEKATETWIHDHLMPHSAAAVRQTRKAARHPWRHALQEVLPALEEQYLGELMRTEDAIEGLDAFLEKRKPHWANR